MKRESSNEARARANEDNADGRTRDIALLVIALFLVVIYFLKQFFVSPERIQSLNLSLKEQAAVEAEAKSSANIAAGKHGLVDAGSMSAEKRLVFSIPIDINMATARDFEALPGIGPKLAQRIVETRKRIGGFKAVGDLKKVKGIGDKKFKKIQERITVGAAVCKK